MEEFKYPLDICVTDTSDIVWSAGGWLFTKETSRINSKIIWMLESHMYMLAIYILLRIVLDSSRIIIIIIINLKLQ
jgi:hypothetical protein